MSVKCSCFQSYAFACSNLHYGQDFFYSPYDLLVDLAIVTLGHANKELLFRAPGEHVSRAT